MKLKLLLSMMSLCAAIPLCALRINEGEFEELVHEFRRAKASGDWSKARDVVQEMEDQGANDWDTQRFRMELNCTTYQPEPCYGAYPRRKCPGGCD